MSERKNKKASIAGVDTSDAKKAGGAKTAGVTKTTRKQDDFPPHEDEDEDDGQPSDHRHLPHLPHHNHRAGLFNSHHTQSQTYQQQLVAAAMSSHNRHQQAAQQSGPRRSAAQHDTTEPDAAAAAEEEEDDDAGVHVIRHPDAEDEEGTDAIHHGDPNEIRDGLPNAQDHDYDADAGVASSSISAGRRTGTGVAAAAENSATSHTTGTARPTTTTEEETAAAAASTAGEAGDAGSAIGNSSDALDGTDAMIDFPTDNDVLLGRGAACWNHVGNRRFRDIVRGYLDAYIKAKLRIEKTMIVSEILSKVEEANGRFLKKQPPEKKRGRRDNWVEVERKAAVEKVGHAIRDQKIQPGKDRSQSSGPGMPLRQDPGGVRGGMGGMVPGGSGGGAMPGMDYRVGPYSTNPFHPPPMQQQPPQQPQRPPMGLYQPQPQLPGQQSTSSLSNPRFSHSSSGPFPPPYGHPNDTQHPQTMGGGGGGGFPHPSDPMHPFNGGSTNTTTTTNRASTADALRDALNVATSSPSFPPQGTGNNGPDGRVDFPRLDLPGRIGLSMVPTDRFGPAGSATSGVDGIDGSSFGTGSHYSHHGNPLGHTATPPAPSQQQQHPPQQQQQQHHQQQQQQSMGSPLPQHIRDGPQYPHNPMGPEDISNQPPRGMHDPSFHPPNNASAGTSAVQRLIEPERQRRLTHRNQLLDELKRTTDALDRLQNAQALIERMHDESRRTYTGGNLFQQDERRRASQQMTESALNRASEVLRTNRLNNSAGLEGIGGVGPAPNDGGGMGFGGAGGGGPGHYVPPGPQPPHPQHHQQQQQQQHQRRRQADLSDLASVSTTMLHNRGGIVGGGGDGLHQIPPAGGHIPGMHGGHIPQQQQQLQQTHDPFGGGGGGGGRQPSQQQQQQLQHQLQQQHYHQQQQQHQPQNHSL